MKQVVLFFPDNIKLSEFILTQRVSGIETKSSEASLKGVLTDDQIVVACTKYEAELQIKTSGLHNKA
jgi:hypothetical protein